MDTEVRNRAVLPILLPVLLLLGIGLFVGTIALILLYSTKTVALIIAVVVAGGILGAVALANTQDEDEFTTPKKAVVLFAGGVPLLLGGVFAAYSAGTDAPGLAIDVERLAAFPEDAVIAAENVEEFCLPTEDGGCEPTREWSFAPQDTESTFFQFQNLQADVGHNVALFTLADEGLTPDSITGESGGEAIFVGDVFNGVAEMVYEVAEPLGEGRYFFQCSVHPEDMIGILEVAEPE